MQLPLQLTKEEQLGFMRALYSVFYRDKQINSTERPVLNLLNRCFDMSTSDYRHYVHVNVGDITKEINAIADVRVRIYFMRVIHDVYRKEIKHLFTGQAADHAKKFKIIYPFLQENIDIKGS
ncbi:hypothetical protein [Methyloprofundus sp.]|uniref:hypothetical protein n=1 Tax=Methyloprofundus sp. TaxID=2020875 RepID=UPI003D12F23E